MFDHLGIFVTDLDKAAAFYEACLAPLNISLQQRLPFGAVVFWKTDRTSGCPFFFVGTAQGDYYGTEISPVNTRPNHLAFRADSKTQVDAFYKAGLAAGGRDNGAPESDGENCYHAFLLDPDGNNIEAAYREGH